MHRAEFQICYFLLLLFFLNGKVEAQVEEIHLTDNISTVLNDSLNEAINMYLFLWADAYYSAYLDYTEDINDFFSFESDYLETIFSEMRCFLLENKNSFSLVSSDSSITIYYKNHFF